MMCGPTVRAALSFFPVGSSGVEAPSQPSPRGRSPSGSPIPTFPKGKELYPNALARGSLVNYPFCEKGQFQLRVTPAANRNSYRVAMISLVDTQGSVLRPQPWAGETQLLQSCCCLWPSHARALFSTFLKEKEFSTTPIQTLPKGKGHYHNALARVGLVFSPLGESWRGTAVVQSLLLKAGSTHPRQL